MIFQRITTRLLLVDLATTAVLNAYLFEGVQVNRSDTNA